MIEVMVIDDSAPIRASLSMILKGAGHVVVEAALPSVALELLEKGAKPDLFILDLNMPGMNGIELLKHIRALTPHRFTPALMLTTETAAGRRAEAKAAGASGWLVKPIAPPDLLRVVKQVCAKAG